MMRIVESRLSFDPWDWSDKGGKAREVITLLKRSGGTYSKEAKVWLLTPRAESLLIEDYGSYIDVSEPMGIDDDLEPVFGTKSNGEVTARGLVGLYGDIEAHLKLIKHLERTANVQDGILEIITSKYEEKLKTFNELVLEKG